MAQTTFSSNFYTQLLEYYEDKITNEKLRIGLFNEVLNALTYTEIVNQGKELDSSSNTGYTTGGKKLENPLINGLELTCNNPKWESSFFSGVMGAFIYDTDTDNVIAIIDYQSVEGLNSDNSTFEVIFADNILIKLK